jgi:hypothetical protein
MHATLLFSIWLSLATKIARCFTRPGQRRFVEWVTGLALNDEEHTITQSLVGLEQSGDWKALESFAEYGAWNGPALERSTAEALEELPERRWYGYCVWAGDDTKVHRNSPDVWGTCTFREYSARCPNRATTVRAHNWVVLGGLVPQDNQPALFFPVAARLYLRDSQRPVDEPFRTKCELLVESLRNLAQKASGPHLAVFDGGYALQSVVRPLVFPEQPNQPRIDFVTRLRCDARLFDLAPTERQPHQRGPLPKWGKRLAAPQEGKDWPVPWNKGTAFLYGRQREVFWKEMVCLWHVLGSEAAVKVVYAQVEGFSEPFTLVTSALSLTGLQVVELFCARYRQEDGFRDLKQRLGWEEGRAWTKNPILRTTQAILLTMTLLRLLQYQLSRDCGDGWWLHPPWNVHKTRPSLLDVQRLLRKHRQEIQQTLSQWLGNEEKELA